jgi:hypothetical protein
MDPRREGAPAGGSTTTTTTQLCTFLLNVSLLYTRKGMRNLAIGESCMAIDWQVKDSNKEGAASKPGHLNILLSCPSTSTSPVW